MKIVNLQTFRRLPPGTVFMKYEPCCFGELQVKESTWETDFISTGLTCSLDTNSSGQEIDELTKAENDPEYSLDVSFEESSRDGMFESKQLFAVYEKKDIKGLINKLNECLEALT